MSMDLGGAKGGVKSDINVTPLVDVMLVLLIIVMLIAPMLQEGISVRLPKATNTVDKPETSGQTTIAIAANGAIYMNALPVAVDELGGSVKRLLEGKRPDEKIVLIKADEEADYRVIMEAMDQLRAGGIEDMGLVADNPTSGGAGGQQ
jgi:biopolymer transport protein TolR